ncbi:hypothetical protein AVEN_108066-1 [Araneus ventricosus]|uniref:Uncharacterized protein n=1 Tax=Araneus ventricosus TaxID=182803 RepID=A0A4Y2KDN4_ARAVE|nr:hypothetical protein AVEN_108066-1 [Araneus ventricosus]
MKFLNKLSFFHLFVVVVGFLSLVILTSCSEATGGLFWDDLVILNCSQMRRTTPDLAVLSKLPHHTSSVESTHDLSCRKPHTRRIFSKIWFRAWNPLGPKLGPYHYTTAAGGF